jgi:hypothetical protein
MPCRASASRCRVQVAASVHSADTDLGKQIVGTLDCGPNRENGREPTTAKLSFAQTPGNKSMYSTQYTSGPPLGKISSTWTLEFERDRTYVTAIERRESGDYWFLYFEGGKIEAGRVVPESVS